MQCDLPQRFPIYDVSGMKDGSSDHNACLSEVSGLCALLSLRAPAGIDGSVTGIWGKFTVFAKCADSMLR